MRPIIKVDLKDDQVFHQQILDVKEVLNAGGVIAYPTDTFYGLGVNPSDRRAVKKIFTVKGRPMGNPILTLVDSPEQALLLTTALPPAARQLIDAFWPGPLTLLLQARPKLPPELTAGTGLIGIRQPGSQLTLRLLQAIGHPLTGTSANLTDGENLSRAEEVQDALGERVDIIVDGGPTPGGKASTLIDTTQYPLRLVRDGAVAREQIEDILGHRLEG